MRANRKCTKKHYCVPNASAGNTVSPGATDLRIGVACVRVQDTRQAKMDAPR